MNFKEKVFQKTKKISKGKVSTYKEIARVIRKPRAIRAVGNVLNKNNNPVVPCHRVIKSDGDLGGYRSGSDKKTRLLRAEGIIIKNNKINLKKYFQKIN
jgi:methylated-DNA-[protein]-cysteine S-methyltransferase